jgi:hypothetical protein
MRQCLSASSCKLFEFPSKQNEIRLMRTVACRIFVPRLVMVLHRESVVLLYMFRSTHVEFSRSDLEPCYLRAIVVLGI